MGQAMASLRLSYFALHIQVSYALAEIVNTTTVTSPFLLPRPGSTSIDVCVDILHLQRTYKSNLHSTTILIWRSD
ncbi:hypothetical protein F5Y18DRAFT_132033 [Xylariaceae sp. FL1019]|nr:hypothetical protein F5Y18DRAFT_132033 [Xylariaceae sp. FL1019]